MTDPLEFRPVFIPPNPLKKLEEAVSETVRSLTEVTTAVSAQHRSLVALQCLAHALIATHPAPTALLQEFQDQMDSLADVMQPNQIEKWREEMQRLQTLILAAAHLQGRNQKPPPSAPAGS